jgi:AcrR family transcriptional regulator
MSGDRRPAPIHQLEALRAYRCLVGGDATVEKLGARPLSGAQHRVIDTALRLFAEYGVSGTSFQMIADSLGVTKAAVANKFKTKDDLVVAVAERELAVLESHIVAAEQDLDHQRGRQQLLDKMVDLAVDNRGMVGTLQFDPVIVRVLADHEPFQRFLARLFGALYTEDDAASAVSAAMLSGAIAVAVMHPLVTALDSEELRAHVRRTARQMVFAPVAD